MMGNQNLKVGCVRRGAKEQLPAREREREDEGSGRGEQSKPRGREGNVGFWRQPCQVPFWVNNSVVTLMCM